MTEDDDAGLVIDIENDFLLSGVNFAISNIATGQIVEDLRHESSGRLIVGRLVPGPYELIVYAHNCITNMGDRDHDQMKSFDILLHMKARLLRMSNRQSHDSRASVTVKVEGYTEGHGNHHEKVQDGSDPESAPLVLSHEELECQKRYLPLPDVLVSQSISGELDMNEEYYIPTQFSYTHHIGFTAKKSRDALRVLLVKTNSKMALFEKKS